MTPERAELIRNVYKENGGWIFGTMCDRMHIPLLSHEQMQPFLYEVIPTEPVVNRRLTYELKLIENRYFVVCEGLTVDSWKAAD